MRSAQNRRLHVATARQFAEVVDRQRRPVEQVHGDVAEPMAQLRERELEHAAADADHAGALRLGDVALRQRPERVELGGDVAEVAPQTRRPPNGSRRCW